MGRVPTPADTGREGAGLQEESAGAAWSRSLRSRAAPPALDVLCAACHSGRTDVSFASGGTRTLRESPRPQTPGGRGRGCRQRALGLHGRALSARERLRLLSTYFAPHVTLETEGIGGITCVWRETNAQRVPTPADTGREGAGLQVESAGAAWSRPLRSRAAPPALDVLCAACHSRPTHRSNLRPAGHERSESPHARRHREGEGATM